MSLYQEKIFCGKVEGKKKREKGAGLKIVNGLTSRKKGE